VPAPTPAAPDAKRQFPLPVLVIAAAAVALVVTGTVLLLGGAGSDPPSVLRGYVALDSRPVGIGMKIPRNNEFYVTDGATLSLVRLWEEEITVWSVAAPQAIQVEALSGVGFRFVAETADSAVLLGSSGNGVEGDVVLPADDCCADVLVGTDNGFIVFPQEDGRSASYLEYDQIDGLWREVRLPAPVTVTSAALIEGYLFIGHTAGLLAVSPWDGCSQPVTLWDQPTAALAVTHLDDRRPTIAALDTQNRAIASIDPGVTFYHQVEDCSGVRSPKLKRTVGIGGPVENYQPTMALIGTTAYVIDTGGIVSVVDVGSSEADLQRSVRLPGGPGEGASLIAVPDWAMNEWNVFVADPAGSRLWWIAAGGSESPQRSIEPIRRSQ
jgi:hypothetical protein